ncbi:MAG: IS66 family transposase [Propionibacteriaceae bacterium]|jgi:transposase|nr:IS66 family transposase [Propionibacteriaceae bacterium]
MAVEIRRLNEALAAEREARAAAEAENAVLRARVADLEARLKTDSTNSSKPPSNDGPAARPRPTRVPTGRSPGGQKGRKGSTLQTVEHPDRVETRRPGRCRGCGHALAGAPAASIEARQVFDLPEQIRLETVEHRIESVACPCCGAVTKADAPPEARRQVQYGPRVKALLVCLVAAHHLPLKRTAEAFAAILGAPISPATVLRAVQEAGGTAGRLFGPVARRALAAAATAHADETSLRVAGSKMWVHSFSTALWTWLQAHPRRGRDAMDEIGILPLFHGVLGHDCWAPYDTYGQFEAHQLCVAHVLRELQAVMDDHAHEDGQWCWAEQAADALRLAVHDPARAAWARARLLAAAACAGELDLEPHPGSRQAMRHTALARRLRTRAGDYLYFTTPEGAARGVEPTNNAAEREIRMVKVKQKIAGCMRTETGAQQFLALRSYIATARKHGTAVLEALASLTSPNPWLPAIP